ncbi:MAG: alpha/beta fold hydrolase [Xanthobacteraceae bacterium]
MTKLYVETIGTGSPALLLLHGLGVNGAVWQPLLSHLKHWPGRIIVPDFRGHGRSPHARPYGLGQHAADLAALLPPDEPVTIVGHSMGGLIGLVLASGWFGVTARAALGLSLKVTWQADELAKLKQLAATPARWFASREEAADRFLRVSGLAAIVDASAPVVTAGVVEEEGRYRLAADPATALVVGPDVGPVLNAVAAPWRLACGSRDPLVRIAELQAYDAQAIEIEGCGHNLHVEQPEALAQIISRL